MRYTFAAIVLLVGCVAAESALAQEWARFRGPNGTGVSETKTIPVKWAASDYAWRAKLPGIGHSCPIVWGDKVFILSADPETAIRYTLCYRASDGEELWRNEYPSEVHHLHPRSSFASSTPAADSERVYFGWSTPSETTLLALDHDGKEAWRLDLGTWTSQHGFGTSPIIYEDMVILHNSQQANRVKEGQKPGKSFMMAFERATGKEVWRTPLVSQNVCYSVPFIYEPEGAAPEVVCTSTGNGLFSIDPQTGKFNWAVKDAFDKRTVASPIFAGGHIFGSTGSGAYSSNYLVAVSPGGRDKDAKIAYQLKNSGKFKAPYVPCAITKGDAVFLLYDRGYAACIDAKTGDINWFEPRTGANFSGSPVRVNDAIYCVDEEGVVWVIAADEKEYRLLAKNELGEPSRSTPAVAGGRMFLRTYSQLFCVGSGEGVE